MKKYMKKRNLNQKDEYKLPCLFYIISYIRINYYFIYISFII